MMCEVDESIVGLTNESGNRIHTPIMSNKLSTLQYGHIGYT